MKNGCRQINRTHVTSLYMKNIIMSIMLGVALLGSAQACNMQHHAHMHGHPGIHKHVKKHAMHRGHRHSMVKRHHKHHFAARPQMKRHVKPMTMGCARLHMNRHNVARPQMKRHVKPMMRKSQANYQPRKYKITFGPTTKHNEMMFKDFPKHLRPTAEQMRKPLVDFDKHKKH